MDAKKTAETVTEKIKDRVKEAILYVKIIEEFELKIDFILAQLKQYDSHIYDISRDYILEERKKLREKLHHNINPEELLNAMLKEESDG